MFVEQRGHKRHVEFRVSTHDIGGGHKLPAVEAVGLFEHTLRSLGEIVLLGNTHRDTHLDFVRESSVLSFTVFFVLTRHVWY